MDIGTEVIVMLFGKHFYPLEYLTSQDNTFNRGPNQNIGMYSNSYFFVEGIYVNYILNMYCLADYIGFTRIGLINPLNLKMQFMKNEYSK